MEIAREIVDDSILVLTLDDGSRNALDIETFESLMAGLDSADERIRAIVIAGREGTLSAGLNIKWMAQASLDDLKRLLVVFGTAMMRLWTEPRPTVCAATGHALAGGTMIAMACDHAVAASGEFAWGLTETQIGFQIPDFGIALAQHNVRVDRLEDLLLPGRKIGPEAAVEAGFADELVAAEDVLPRALAVAAELAALPPKAYGGTKDRIRGIDAAAILANLPTDIDGLTSGPPG